MLDKKNPSQKAIMTEDMKIAIAGPSAVSVLPPASAGPDFDVQVVTRRG